MIGIIGTGNMGGALASALAKSGCKLALSDVCKEKAEALAKEIGAEVSDNQTLAKNAEILFLGVKPQTLPQLLADLRPALWARGADLLVVSMATGVTVDRVKVLCESPSLPVIRIMPNLAVAVGAGTILYCASPEVTSEQLSAFQELMQTTGNLFPLRERLIDPGSAVTGCGPAFVAVMIDAMADGLVAYGIPKKEALSLAEAMTMGTAKLLLEQKKHPGQLKDEVCSPAGTTIQGIRVLENQGVRGAFFEAVAAACETNKKL